MINIRLTRLIPNAHISDRVPYEQTFPIRSGFSNKKQQIESTIN